MEIVKKNKVFGLFLTLLLSFIFNSPSTPAIAAPTKKPLTSTWIRPDKTENVRAGQKLEINFRMVPVSNELPAAIALGVNVTATPVVCPANNAINPVLTPTGAPTVTLATAERNSDGTVLKIEKNFEIKVSWTVPQTAL